MKALLTCPLCRTDLERLAIADGDDGTGFSACPSCGADLAPYRDLKAKAQNYFAFAQDLISRGELDAAQTLVDELPQIIGEGELQLSGLMARLALAQGDFAKAVEFSRQCEPEERAILAAAIQARTHSQNTAHEQYNYALTAARDGKHHLAAKWLCDATELDPHNPAIWQLKLKVDLAAKDFQATYLDLSELDRLSARPMEFHALEQLLPPLG